MTTQQTIAFIGGGNMARSLIGGLIQDGIAPDTIRVYDTSAEALQRLHEQFGVVTTPNAATLVDGADCIVLAVKPQVMHGVCRELGKLLDGRQPLLLSIAAGIRIASIARWLAAEHAIIRCMPNTPALIQAGASALLANARVNQPQRDLAESIMRSAGITLWVDNEDMLDAVTALSGSGPAYVFLVLEAMQQAGEQLGLAPQQARLLALQTVFGAARMALEDSEPVTLLRERVTSKGGTTEQALASFARDDLLGTFLRAMTAARDRSRQLAEELDRSGE